MSAGYGGGLFDSVLGALGGEQGIQRIAQQLGADPESTAKGMAAALPALLAGLARQTEGGRGEELDRALGEDHDGSLVDQLGAALTGTPGHGVPGGGYSGLTGLHHAAGTPAATAGAPYPEAGAISGGAGSLLGALFGGHGGTRAANGDGILRHVFGGRRAPVEEGIERASGLGRGQASQLLAMLAPVVMGVLGRAKRERGLQGPQLTDLLRRESEDVERQVGTAAATTGETAARRRTGGLAAIFDADGDGDVRDEVAKIGTALAGAFLLGKLRR